MDPGGLEGAEQVRGAGGEVIHPVAELAGGVGVFEGAEAFAVAAGLVDARDPRRRHQLRHVGHALLELPPAVHPPLPDAPEDILRALLDEAGELAASVLLEPPARRVGNRVVHARHLERLRVVPGDVAAPVGDPHRMVGGGFVEIVPVDPPVLAVLGDLGVVVLEAVHPVAGLGVGGGGADRQLDVVNGAHIEVHLEEVAHSPRVAVGINEAGDDGHAAGVHHFDPGAGEVPDLLVRAHCGELAVLDGERLGAVHGGAAGGVFGGVHAGVPDDEVGAARPRPAAAGGGGETGSGGGAGEFQEFGSGESGHGGSSSVGRTGVSRRRSGAG